MWSLESEIGRETGANKSEIREFRTTGQQIRAHKTHSEYITRCSFISLCTPKLRIDIQMTGVLSSDRRTMNRVSIKYQVGLDHRVLGVSV